MLRRLIGFEELGNNDAFETAALELRLSMCGERTCLVYVKSLSTRSPGVVQRTTPEIAVFTASSRELRQRDEEEDFDLDE